jgi:hypothetical protein
MKSGIELPTSANIGSFSLKFSSNYSSKVQLNFNSIFHLNLQLKTLQNFQSKSCTVDCKLVSVHASIQHVLLEFKHWKACHIITKLKPFLPPSAHEVLDNSSEIHIYLPRTTLRTWQNNLFPCLPGEKLSLSLKKSDGT